ncbi:MAG TPA: MFS transporter [Bacteroidaceae bacterium]|nr:MFS transporter [Bacteroidaceae bacterium]
MKKRNIVLILLMVVGVITFLDRINISVAGASIMEDLDLTGKQWGWVLSAFILSYGLLQVPLGAWGDRSGQRKVLSVIVLWWSLFTILTGFSNGFVMLLIIRFLFGIGEAGAYPNMTGTVGRWFPRKETARAQGYLWAASRIGGALTPLIVVPVIIHLGWRVAFYILGGMGFIWVLVWFTWFRNFPSQKKGIARDELAEIGHREEYTKKVIIPWKIILRRNQFWILLAMYWFYAWGSWFFFSWFPVFMEEGRGFSKSELTYAVAVPFLFSVIGNISGGYISDRLTLKYGLNIGRKAVGISALALSSVLMFLAGFIPGKLQVFIFLSFCFGIFDLMLPAAWAICLDIGKKYGGAISGAMNTAGNIGGFVCAISFGYLVDLTGNYNFPLYLISAMLLLSALMFFFINPSKKLVEDGE